MEEHKEIKEEIKEEIVEKVEIAENTVDEVDVPLTKPKREKKPRTEKQIAAFEKARLKRMEKLNEKKKEAAKKLLDIKEEEVNTAKQSLEEEKEEVKEKEEELVEEELVEEVIEKKPPRKTVKVVKRKKPVKQPKQIVFENSDSDTDNDEILEEVYHAYKKELKKRKQSRPKAPAPLERHQGIQNLKFV